MVDARSRGSNACAEEILPRRGGGIREFSLFLERHFCAHRQETRVQKKDKTVRTLRGRSMNRSDPDLWRSGNSRAIMPQTPTMIGTVVSHYRIAELLGSGGMGVVYRAEDTRLGRTVALKFLSPDFASDRAALDRFRREARTASTLNHPNICTIHDIDEYSGQLFIVMEFLEGRTLRQRLEAGPLEINEVLDVSLQVADALEAAHSKNIVHRDIKAANIFITHTGQIKVLDFGLAKRVSAQEAETVDVSPSAVTTAPGMILGTIDYMSPEQAMGEELDRRTDLFSLTVVLYEMSTGTLPFRGETVAAVFNEILNKEPLAPATLRPHLPSALQQVIIMGLRKDRKDRYQTARDLRRDLEIVKHDPGRGLTIRVSKEWQSTPSMAVLPFVNLTGEKEHEYFSDGLAEDLLDALSKVAGLSVASRTSSFQFKGKDTDVRDIGRQLSVSTVLEGSVRSLGNRVRISARLVSVADGYQIWSERYDCEMRDLFAIQDEISRAIVEALKIKLAEKQRLIEAATPDLEAYHFYLKGRYHASRRNSEGLKKGIENFQKAIARDPQYALAYSSLAESYLLTSMHAPLPPNQVWPQAMSFAKQALLLDDSLGAAHASIANVLACYEWNWIEAEREFKRAIELNPQNAMAHMTYGTNYLSPMGRLEEAITEIKRSLELEPLSLIGQTTLGGTLHHMREFQAAIEQLKKVIDLDPGFYFAYWSLGRSYVCAKQFAEAEKAFVQAIELSGGIPMAVGTLAHLNIVMGHREEGLRDYQRLVAMSQSVHVPAILMAAIQAAAENYDEALKWLEKGYEDHSPWMIWLARENSLEPLHSDPRFAALVQKIGLPWDASI